MSLGAFDDFSDEDEFPESDVEDDLKIVVYHNGQLNEKQELKVPQGTTVEELKCKLSKTDLSGPTNPIGLKPPGADNPLPDSAVLSSATSILEICAPNAEADSNRKLVHRKTLVLDESPVTPVKNIPPCIDVALPVGTFTGLKIPKDCTIGRFIELLEKGELLGRKILYASRLTCYVMTNGVIGPVLELGSLIPSAPATLAVDGPDPILQDLMENLTDKLGDPDESRPASPVSKTSAQMPLPLVSGKEDDALEYFFLGLTGQRDYMEDRANAFLELPGCGKGSSCHASFFGVFDGHGGYQVADLVARGLPKLVGAKLAQDRDPVTSIEEAFSNADEELRSGSKSAFDMIGTTAIVTVAQRGEDGKVQKLYCANCGDSRAVLCRGGEAMEISEDHKPTNPSEEERILKAGGWINRSRVQMSQGGEGGLLLSRSLGDFGYKAQDKPVLICQPDVQVIDIGPEDEFVALGSDGVFDAYTSEELVAEIQEGLARGEALGDIVESIVEQALVAGDNTTLCVVRFKH